MSEMDKSADFYSQYPKNEAGYTVSQNNVPRAPIFSKVGFASEKICPPTTLIQVAKDSCAKFKDYPVLKIEEVDTTPPAKGQPVPPSVELDQWKTWTYGKYYDDSECVARAFIKLGMKRFDAVSIYGFNHPAWHMSAMGAVLGCGIVAGIYPTDTPEQVLYKVKHSGAAIAVVENVKKMETFLSLAGDLPYLKAIVVWDHKGADLSSKVSEKSRSCMAGSEPSEDKVKCMTWEELVAMGKKRVLRRGAETNGGLAIGNDSWTLLRVHLHLRYHWHAKGGDDLTRQHRLRVQECCPRDRSEIPRRRAHHFVFASVARGRHDGRHHLPLVGH
jgi:hypothetical protein